MKSWVVGSLFVCCVMGLLGCQSLAPPVGGPVTGWLSWRGPDQNGYSTETGLPDRWTLGGENHLWTYELPGRGAPVVAGERVYAWGYDGEGADLREVLVCLDARSGRRLWERRFNDFISDIVYLRYSIGTPAVDAATGNVYVMTSPGLLAAFTADGAPLWERSLMEEYGRLTFPNGRTGSPVIEGDLVIVHAVTSNWGADGPARDRFYAFSKRDGQLVWNSTPGTAPKDSSFATPVLAWLGARRVLYCGLGCGNVVAVDVRTGDPLWRMPLSAGGVNSGVLIDGDGLIAIHGQENLDASTTGRMVRFRPALAPPGRIAESAVLGKEAEVWRQPLEMFTSSPTLMAGRVYQVVRTGELNCLDAASGRILWKEKLGNEQLHASPLAADGKLYIPMRSGQFFILRPGDTGVERLCEVQLDGEALGAPTVWQGRIFVHTTKRLYCFGTPGPRPQVAAPTPPAPPAGPLARLQVIPAEVLLGPGARQPLTVRGLDAVGAPVALPADAAVAWQHFIPPTAKVKAVLDAEVQDGALVVPAGAHVSAGAFEAGVGGVKGYLRGRVMPNLPLAEDFEHFALDVPHEQETGVKFAYPPLPWIGARFKWEVRELDGSKVLAKTLDTLLFQRAVIFLGGPDLRDYTVAADVRSEGTRRMMSSVGVVNQRYIVALVGNAQTLEVSSNYDRIQVSVPFAWKPDTWYRLKTRVDVAADGSGVVRAKAWARGQPEPTGWTIEVPHAHAHAHGAPGLYGFAYQNQKRVFIDNVSVTPNGKDVKP